MRQRQSGDDVNFFFMFPRFMLTKAIKLAFLHWLILSPRYFVGSGSLVRVFIFWPEEVSTKILMIGVCVQSDNCDG